MALKKHHKIIIGSFSSIVVIYMIINAVLLNGIIVKQNLNYNGLSNKISDLQVDTQNQINILANNLIQVQESVEENQEALELELDLLKVSAGEDFSGIIEDAIKAVVAIKTDYGSGTGFIISEEGYIVTNAHVLADSYGNLATGIKAVTHEQKTISADFIGYDGALDIALLKINGNYEILELADSDNIQIGERVIAIGNPLGLQFSVSQGIVSALDRTGINEIPAYIQTDAPLNPGNSGGPLINTKGKVIGINNFKMSGTEGIGFALESNYIKDTINNIAQEKLGKNLV